MEVPTSELIETLEHLDGFGFRGSAIKAAAGDGTGLVIEFGKGVALDRALRALKYIKLLRPAVKGGAPNKASEIIKWA